MNVNLEAQTHATHSTHQDPTSLYRAMSEQGATQTKYNCMWTFYCEWPVGISWWLLPCLACYPQVLSKVGTGMTRYWCGAGARQVGAEPCLVGRQFGVLATIIHVNKRISHTIFLRTLRRETVGLCDLCCEPQGATIHGHKTYCCTTSFLSAWCHIRHSRHSILLCLFLVR